MSKKCDHNGCEKDFEFRLWINESFTVEDINGNEVNSCDAESCSGYKYYFCKQHLEEKGNCLPDDETEIFTPDKRSMFMKGRQNE